MGILLRHIGGEDAAWNDFRLNTLSDGHPSPTWFPVGGSPPLDRLNTLSDGHPSPTGCDLAFSRTLEWSKYPL